MGYTTSELERELQRNIQGQEGVDKRVFLGSRNLGEHRFGGVATQSEGKS